MSWQRRLILDVALVAALIIGSLRVQESWKQFQAKHRVEAVQPEKEIALNAPGALAITATPEDWTEISVKNPFSFDRTDVSIVAPKVAPPTQLKPVLFGTMSIGNQWVAMLAPGQSGNSASRPVKVGESLGDWQVVEIRDASVIVTAANGIRETIIMNDPAAQVPRSGERTGTAAPPPVNVVATSAPTPAQTTTPTANTPATSPTTTQHQPGAQPAEEWLDTPFGRVRRTK